MALPPLRADSPCPHAAAGSAYGFPLVAIAATACPRTSSPPPRRLLLIPPLSPVLRLLRIASWLPASPTPAAAPPRGTDCPSAILTLSPLAHVSCHLRLPPSSCQLHDQPLHLPLPAAPPPSTRSRFHYFVASPSLPPSSHHRARSLWLWSSTALSLAGVSRPSVVRSSLLLAVDLFLFSHIFALSSPLFTHGALSLTRRYAFCVPRHSRFSPFQTLPPLGPRTAAPLPLLTPPFHLTVSYVKDPVSAAGPLSPQVLALV